MNRTLSDKPFLLGCNGRGAQHIPGTAGSIDDQFRLVKESGVFDFFDRLPQPGLEDEYLRASEKYDLPITTGLWSYTMGRDEDLLLANLQLARRAGSECHNIMLYRDHADGHALSDPEVAQFYRYAYEAADRLGILITFEVHIYMWSEDVRRVSRVAHLVRQQGLPFNFLLDHSHVLLKLENPTEQDRCGITSDVVRGDLRLDPFDEGNIVDEWIEQNMTRWMSVRPVAPNGPLNTLAHSADGVPGRACQYPFVRPPRGEFHAEWFAYKVEPCKEVVRKMLRFHAARPDSVLRYITTEFIDLIDYGEGARYSLFDQSVALATWIRDEWARIRENSPGSVDEARMA